MHTYEKNLYDLIGKYSNERGFTYKTCLITYDGKEAAVRFQKYVNDDLKRIGIAVPIDGHTEEHIANMIVESAMRHFSARHFNQP